MCFDYTICVYTMHVLYIYIIHDRVGSLLNYYYLIKCVWTVPTKNQILFVKPILEYDEVRDLPEYDFSERVQLLKKLHCDLSGTILRGNCKRPTSTSTSRCSKRKTSGKKKKTSKTTKNAIVSPSLCNVRFFWFLFVISKFSW